ncbi:MAG: FAD-dependent oxidoreductase, partial [Anaerolineaceae bacterium]|nr:FAD-dependent oxidoreductase [Anaerolineaceae bacterium]
GLLATIGRNQAVAHFGRWKFHGLIAWLLWVVVHIYQLVGYRNRLAVLLDWAWSYVFYDHAVRLIQRA